MERNRSMSVSRLVPFGCAAFLAVVWVNWLTGVASTEAAAPRPDTERPGVCERQAVKLVGQKAVRVDTTIKGPKKIPNVSPHYPPWPPGATGRGTWIGEALIDSRGRVSHVWPIREVEITPPLPAFNEAIVDAIRQWEFEPLVVDKRKVPVCMTVSVNINWS
jgi:hypothetical protein